jgi:hypothetical protein
MAGPFGSLPLSRACRRALHVGQNGRPTLAHHGGAKSCARLNKTAPSGVVSARADIKGRVGAASGCCSINVATDSNVPTSSYYRLNAILSASVGNRLHAIFVLAKPVEEVAY